MQLWRTSSSSRDTYVVLAMGGLMGTHVILRSLFFLPFTGREDAHMSKWIFAFFLQISSSQQGMQGLDPSPWSAKCQEGHSDHLPKISGKSQSTSEPQ